MKSSDGNLIGEGQGDVRLGGIGAGAHFDVVVDLSDFDRVVDGAEKSGVCAGITKSVVGNRPGDGEAGRERGLFPEVGEHRADGGKVRTASVIGREGPWGRHGATGEGMIDGDAMIGGCVIERADDGELFGMLRDALHLVAEKDSRNRCLNRPERTADARWGVGLHIPHVLLRLSAPHEQEDAGAGLAGF